MSKGMSDNEFSKKECEAMQLDFFLPEYTFATGHHLTYHPYCSRSEAPDFICWDEAGPRIGIELTRLQIPPRYVEPLNDTDSGLSALSAVHNSCARKAGLGGKTILVLQVHDGFESLISELCSVEPVEPNKFDEYGLMEIWLADYSKVEAFGSVELFCIAPTHLYGHYIPSFDGCKPYG
ncbi:MAG: hypothetical protein HYV26_23620 [Candidatus Hydrogenedentes bacterium]|nr:hypothetical protein [Candidatus Hydrogenedentota bacterium]